MEWAKAHSKSARRRTTANTKKSKQRQFEELQEKDPNRWKKPPRDPAVSEVVEAIKGVSTHRLYMNCYLSKSTIQKLRKPDGTRRPQHMTLSGVLSAVGLEFGIRRIKR